MRLFSLGSFISFSGVFEILGGDQLEFHFALFLLLLVSNFHAGDTELERALVNLTGDGLGLPEEGFHLSTAQAHFRVGWRKATDGHVGGRLILGDVLE